MARQVISCLYNFITAELVVVGYLKFDIVDAVFKLMEYKNHDKTYLVLYSQYHGPCKNLKSILYSTFRSETSK